jgi:hypothetical protein
MEESGLSSLVLQSLACKLYALFLSLLYTSSKLSFTPTEGMLLKMKRAESLKLARLCLI